MKRTVLVVLVLAGALAACSKGPSVAWTAPGWYLELPYPVIYGGPAVYGGPMSYDECEVKRLKEVNPERFLCVNETKKPTKYGFY
ncbi:MAG TPA: hypothetical protein VFB13_21740 [Reyranella sp.]|jgi:hypothetical protein|nr:hypothetical protein [Reyranella sp.]